MAVEYVDTAATIQVLGCVYNNVSFLDDDKYFWNEEDFANEFHRLLFGSIYNLHALGAKEVSITSIEDYLSNKPKKRAVYELNKGREYLENLGRVYSPATFNYYYQRLKKFTLLRQFHQKCGMDLSFLYDINNISDSKKKEMQEEFLDNTPIDKLADMIIQKAENVRSQFVDNSDTDIVDISQGLDDFLEKRKKHPDIGYPLFGRFVNTVTRGARLGKFYLRSAATNVGKSRAMVADACTIGVGRRWSVEKHEWIDIGQPEPTLYICVEQDLDEVQSMVVAFISGVDESHISMNRYEDGELERVEEAIRIVKRSKLKFKELPDFSLADLEGIIKRGIVEETCRYIFYDYLCTSMKILEEITARSGGVKMREDQILALASTKLKQLCQVYQVFIMTSTQLNADYQESITPDQNLLRGSKAVADKCDVGMIMLDVTDKDREALGSVVSQLGIEMPNIKISVYKNRGNGFRSIYLWCCADKSICQYQPVFVTDWRYNIMEVEDLQIKIHEESIW